MDILFLSHLTKTKLMERKMLSLCEFNRFYLRSADVNNKITKRAIINDFQVGMLTVWLQEDRS